jgi:hypothetical protein
MRVYARQKGVARAANVRRTRATLLRGQIALRGSFGRGQMALRGQQSLRGFCERGASTILITSFQQRSSNYAVGIKASIF